MDFNLPSSRRKSNVFIVYRRLAITGSAVGVGVLFIVLATLFMPNKSVWAQALERFRNCGAMVIKIKTIAPNNQPRDLGGGSVYTLVVPFSGVAYARQTNGMKMWLDGRSIIACMTQANSATIVEPVTDKGEVPPCIDILSSFNEYIGKHFSADNYDYGFVDYEGKKYLKCQLRTVFLPLTIPMM